MAITLTDNRIPIDQADATTGWTSSATASTGSADPVPVETTFRLGHRNNATSTNAYFTQTLTDFQNTLVYAWVALNTTVVAKASGGLQIQLGDGTNRIGYFIAGNDVASFRHDAGPTAWQCMVLDTGNLPTDVTVFAGSAASLNLAQITQVGVAFVSTTSAVGNIANCFWDIMRYGASGIGLTITGGASGTPGKFSEIAAADRLTGDLQGHGLIRELAPGLYGAQGVLKFGDIVGTTSTWFEDKNASLVFESRGLTTTRYQIIIQDNGTGTATFRLGTKVGTGVTATGADGCSIIAPPGVGWKFDAATDTDVTDVKIYGTTFKGATGGVSFRAGHEFIGGLIDTSGQVVANGATFVNTSVLGSTVVADASALLWNVNTNPDGFLDGMTFSKGTNAHHAIQLGASAPAEVHLRGITFTGFSATNEVDDSVVLLADTGANRAWIINKVGGSGTVSVKKTRAGDSYTVVADPVTALVNVKNTEGANIASARVYVKASDGTGPFPFEESVTIVNAGTTATVTHTGHGMADNDKVVISGADQEANNGIFTIDVTDPNTYTYTMGSSPPSPGGTIISTFVAIHGLTDASGNISMSRVFPTDQPVSGWVRKHSIPPDYTPPNYKTGPIGGTIKSASGFTANVQLVSDD